MTIYGNIIAKSRFCATYMLQKMPIQFG